MYRGYDILAAMPFRVTRNSNLYVQEEESRSLLESVRSELHNRRKGDAVRLEIVPAAPRRRIWNDCGSISSWKSGRSFARDGPVNVSRLFNIYEQVPRADLKYHPFTAREVHLTGKVTEHI